MVLGCETLRLCSITLGASLLAFVCCLMLWFRVFEGKVTIVVFVKMRKMKDFYVYGLRVRETRL